MKEKLDPWLKQVLLRDSLPIMKPSGPDSLPPEQCPVDRTLAVIGYRWAGRVIWHLLDGRKRHGELLRAMPGISPKTLTDRLRELEHAGFLVREQFAEIPPRVEYELTERGRTLATVFEAMAAWGQADSAAMAERR